MRTKMNLKGGFRLLFLITAFLISVMPQPAESAIVAVCGEGYLEMINGHRILHLKGTSYEMGYQYGALAGKDIAGVVSQLPKYAGTFGVPPALTSLAMDLGANLFEPYFLEEEMEQLRGIIAGMDDAMPGHTVKVSDLVFLNSLIDAGGIFGEMFCDGFAAWDDLTVDGKVFQTRNVDLMIGSGLEYYTAIIIVKETGKAPFCNLSWTGMIGVASGLSGYGIGVSQIWGTTTDHEFGRPWPLNIREGLSEKSSGREVAQILIDEPHRTYGSNFVFGDAHNVCGWALETTANHSALFKDNDPKELQARYRGECYAIRIENAVFRADTAMDPTIRSLQTASHGPDGDPRTAGAYKNRYQGQADRIIAYRDAGIKIGHEQAEAISRETAMRSGSLQCCVYNNTDRQVWVADAVIDDEGNALLACDQEYFHYDFDSCLPTIELKTNTRNFHPGSVLTLTMDTSNLGTDQTAHVYVALELDGNVYFYPSFSTTPEPISRTFDQYDENTETLLSVKLPPEFPKGKHKWYGAVVNPKTGKLADLSIQEWIMR